ncbi:MAG: V/A-type H+/Na+-transporting ATPase subunit [Planctomycetota bacterium]|nr:V/A-type H+/Na+-transporting ATPase subunit [Planctomycetota bacterium]
MGCKCGSIESANCHCGRIVGINGNMLTVEFFDSVKQNEIAYAILDDIHLKAEVVRTRGRYADLQILEEPKGLKVGGHVDFTGELMAVELGPGLLTQIFDGLQNPLPGLAKQCGFFLKRGMYLDALSRDKEWEFTPAVKKGDTLSAGDTLGTVPEGIFVHRIMVPFSLKGRYSVERIATHGSYRVSEIIAELQDMKGFLIKVSMVQKWPVKIPLNCYHERLMPTDTLMTKIRMVDTFFPVARGGTFCIPGPFGAGKTVLQQMISKNAEVDIVVVAACGERAGEVAGTLREFPELIDPRTGKSLMERTVIICNTSSMPVAAREASIYTAVTLAEYYRQMGLHVLLLVDSTSRWAQALREVSGRLEEIPGDEAFPAYLESVIAAFYERAAIVKLRDGTVGSVTIGGTVSPAGGNFDEPVTQATLKVVGAFLGLSRERSNARRYPAIHPLESWSKYWSIIKSEDLKLAQKILKDGNDIAQMMKVVGEEGTSIDDFVMYLKSEYLDAVYMQQNAFHAVDGAVSAERQRYIFNKIVKTFGTKMAFHSKDEARTFFQILIQKTKDWNYMAMESDEFQKIEAELDKMIGEVAKNAQNIPEN